MKLRPLLPVALALLALRAPAAEPKPHPSIPAAGTLDGLGVNIHFTDPQPGELEMIAAAGFKWVRNDLTWGATERERGQYDFSAYDRLVAALEAQKMHALFILDYDNRLYDGGLSPSTDEGRAAFARWAVAVVSHFKGKGCIWELWNEPNGTFWKPRADVDGYIALAKVVGKALREAGLIRPADQAATPTSATEAYIGPATSEIDMGYLEACCKAGLLDYWDAVSVHPYRQREPERAEEEYRKLRLVIQRYAPADRAVPIISGEWGYSSVWKDFDEARQAKYLPRELLTNISNGVPLSIWYDWKEDGGDPKEPEHHFGIVHRQYRAGQDPAFEPKPAYLAAKELTSQLAGMHYSKRLADDPASRILLFDGNGQQKLVRWDVPYSLGGTDSAPVYQSPKDAAEARAWRILAGWARLPLEYSINAADKFSVSAQLSNNGADDTITADLSIWRTAPLSTVRAYAFRNLHVAPQETQVRTGELRFDPKHPQSRVVETLQLPGDPHSYIQSAPIIARNALEAQLLPGNATVYPAQVENPSGAALDGLVKLDFMRKGQPGLASEQITFAKGETEKVVYLSTGGPDAEPKILRIEDLQQTPLYEGQPRPMQKVEGFDAAHLRVTVDGDAKVAGEATLSDDLPPEGAPVTQEAAVRIKSHFGEGWKFFQFHLDPAPAPFAKPPIALGLWIYGDGQQLKPRLRITDASGQIFQPDGPRIDWKGWRYVTIPLQSPSEHPVAHWGGGNDGVIHAPAKWNCLLLLDNGGRKALDSEIWVSAPTLCY